MQTRCPTCETIFRFTAEQATAASGMVQCGVCHGFFNSMNNRQDAGSDKTEDKPARPVIAIGGGFSGISALQSSLIDNYVPTRPALPWWATLLWSVAILLALASILGQMAWFNIKKLAAQEDLKPYVEAACNHLPCVLEQQRDLAKIELLSRDVRSHPTRKGALLITATFINRADFRQPYPRVGLILSNLKGENIAARYFLADEYLPDEYMKEKTGPQPIMPTEVPSTMVMEVLDPGDETISFRFDFQ